MKIKFISILLLLISTLISCTNNTKPNIDKLNLDFNKLLKHKSVHYKVKELYYYSDVADSTTTPYEVWICRDKSDTTRGAYIWANNNYRPYNMVLDNGNFYFTIPPKNVSIVYPSYTESIIGSNDWIDIFLKPSILYKQMHDSSIVFSFKNIKYNGKACTELVFSFPKNESDKVNTITYIVDNKNVFPIKAVLLSKGDQRTYTNELYFSDVKFDNVDIDSLKVKHKVLIENNPIEDSNSEITALERMLHIGDNAPLFNGKFYGSNTDFKLENYIGKKVILIDFWYTHCPPCVRAIPSLSDLYINNKNNDFIIFGLNSVDNQPHSLKNLKKFLSKRDVSYNIILTKAEVDRQYKINGYPSMYIIDLEGKIAYVELGFDNESFKKLKSRLEILLEK